MRKWIQRTMMGFLLVIGLVVAGLFSLGRYSRRQPHSHRSAEQLAPCGTSPNCVCSCDERPEFQVTPLALAPGEDGPAGMARLKRIVASLPRTRVITDEPGYLHVEFRSATFGFADDVEFLLAEGPSRIHLRAAARVGHSDLGVNRKRIESIRAAFSAATKAAS